MESTETLPKTMKSQYMVFHLGDEAYGIESSHIREVARLKELRINKLPSVPDHIMGLIHLRGEVFPVMSLKRRLGIVEDRTIVNEKDQRMLLVWCLGALVGLVVDRIVGVVETSSAEHIQPPAELERQEPYIISIVRGGACEKCGPMHSAVTFFTLDPDQLG